jgi:prolyl-tRNA editing enzyme YbaK/EbsC (Cys-tRNA(Pro) deacylase)
MRDRPDAVKRVEADAEAKGLKIAVVETATSARSAAEAAEAVGASVGQIVKSLVFRGQESGEAYLLLVSGANRVDESAIAAMLGEGLERPDADFVRAATGFAIGGVSPLGGTGRLRTFMDEDLFQHATVWAAAGTPRHVFEVVPLQLRSATGAMVGRVT